MSAFEVLALNTSIPQIQAAQSGDSYVMVVNATTPALRITQTGTGNALEVEDSSNPDATPFVVSAAGDVGIGTSSPGAKLEVSVGRAATVNSGIFATSGTGVVGDQNRVLVKNVNTAAGANYGVGIGGYLEASASNKASLLLFYDSGTATTEGARLDSSGNLGLGVTPSAWGGSFKALQVTNATALWSATNGDLQLSNNEYFDGTNSIFIYGSGSAYASQYQQKDGKHIWKTAASGTANTATITNGVSYTIITSGNQTAFGAANNNVGTVFTATSSGTLSSGTVSQNISFTQAMTLDASGNLLVGTTTSSLRTITAGTSIGIANTNGAIYFGTTGTPAGSGGFGENAAIARAGGTNFHISGSVAGDLCIAPEGTKAILFGTSASASSVTERARITSGGDFRLGTTTHALAANRRMTVLGTAGIEAVATGTGGEPCLEAWQKHTSGDNVFVDFLTESTVTSRGSITYNRTGGLVAYNTTSDYRAKDVFGPVTDTGATIDALKVYNGKMKGATVERPMLIAHEAQTVTPYAVTGEKDAVDEDGKPKYQQMDVSSLVPLLIAELQSLRARVAQLEAK